MKGPLDYAVKAGINLLRVYRDYRPLKFFGIFGFLFLCTGVALGIWILTFFIYNGNVGGLPRVIFSTLFIIIGIQIFLFGFLADMVKQNK